MALVVDPEGVAAVVAAIEAAPLVAFDLEFLSADRLVPTLCLVQIGWSHLALDAPVAEIVATPPTIALLDPLAVDVGPAIRALASHRSVIAHAPRQDLGLLATRFGIAMPAILDTQTMAAFAGIGDQVGLAALVHDLAGVALAKEHQWTDWAKRPLSPAQLAYAEADVTYLPAIAAKLAARLGARLAWARAESSQIAADAVAAAAVTPATAWQQLNGLRGLDATAVAALIELAAWRQRVAIELDRPLGQIVNDKQLLELARARPANEGALRAVKGLSELARRRANEILAALAAARPAEAPTVATWRSPSTRAQRWAEILLVLVQVVADESNIAARLLATRADVEEFARAVDEHGPHGAAESLPALATWRRELVGNLWLQWLQGKVAITGDREGVHLVNL